MNQFGFLWVRESYCNSWLVAVKQMLLNRFTIKFYGVKAPLNLSAENDGFHRKYQFPVFVASVVGTIT